MRKFDMSHVPKIIIGKMRIISRENIKLTKATYLYSTLSLIAEIGGFVGLFLGVSIIQVNAVIDKIFDVICSKLG